MYKFPVMRAAWKSPVNVAGAVVLERTSCVLPRATRTSSMADANESSTVLSVAPEGAISGMPAIEVLAF